jgi:hypothetical protein
LYLAVLLDELRDLIEYDRSDRALLQFLEQRQYIAEDLDSFRPRSEFHDDVRTPWRRAALAEERRWII